MKTRPGEGIRSEKKQQRELFRLIGVTSTVGVNMVISTFVGFAIGYWLLDHYLGTFPVFTLIFLVLGIAAGFKYLFKVALKQKENGNSEQGN